MNLESSDEFNEIMNFIDQKLALNNVPIQQRVLDATFEFVRDFLLQVSTEKEENFKNDLFKKQWFAEIYKYIKSWYCSRYGDSFLKKSSNSVHAVISIFYSPFEVEIPLFVSGAIEVPGKSAWFTIPNSILPKEDVIEWIVSPPGLDSQTPKFIDDIYSKISFVGMALRSIHVNLMTAEKKDMGIEEMSSGILTHLENAAKDILLTASKGITYAFWELHLAVEKTIKCYLVQHGLKNPYNHNLIEMFETAEKYKCLKFNRKKLEGLPSSKQAIKFRYGEEVGTNSEYAISKYNDVLSIIQELTASFDRKIFMNNASFLIQKPPWY